jgi:quercetin dioxygenase-like cupin family protein
MIAGELELVVEGVRHQLRPGQVFVIPPDARHSGRALTACRVLDAFAPVREDYK